MRPQKWILAALLSSCAAPSQPAEPEEPAAPAASLVESSAATSSPKSSSGDSDRSNELETSNGAAPSPTGSAAPLASVSAASTGPFAAPPLIDEHGAPLPQTEQAPSATSAFFQRGARELFAAIVEDAPERALPFFFPVVAYRQVKDIEDPERDHARRLVRHFERDVHEYHRKLGADAASAVFVELRVPEQKVRWMKPGKEGNRIGYHRVTRSNLVYRTNEGKERSLEITSLISWRGEWYVVHLNGFE
jgi:hypothetical protein